MSDPAPLIKQLPERFEGTLIFLVLFAVLMPWWFTQINVALNTNHAWLMIAAMRLLDGGQMLIDVFETNPPLSVLLYFPPAFMSKYMAVPIQYAPYIFGFFGLALSSRAVRHFLSMFKGVDRHERRIFLCAYILASTILPTVIFFAERDQFLLWGLFPFLLAQILLTFGTEVRGVKTFVVLLLCSLCIFIKPHYVIFPCLLFLHRLIVRRSFVSVVTGTDFIAIAVAAMLYAVVVLVFYMDYVTQILPDFLSYYVSYVNKEVVANFIQHLFLILIPFIVLFVFDLSKRDKTITALCLGAAILSLCLFLMQGKGYYYHLIPTYVFLFCGCCWFFYARVRLFIKNSFYASLLSLFVFTAAAYSFAPIRSNYVTHDEYRELPLSEFAKSCGSNCSFFVFSQNMEMVWQASIYSGVTHASRFPGFWWLHAMLEDGYDPAEKEKYDRYVAEDLRRYKPAKLAIANNLSLGDGQIFNFMEFFGTTEAVRKEMSYYKKVGILKDNRADYFTSTNLDADFPIEYDIYERQQ